jgi:hypothetical protein
MNKKILFVFLFISLTEGFMFDNKLNIIKNKIKINNRKIYKKIILKNEKIPKLIRYVIHNNFSIKEAELKHARIAMLAVIGRIFAEVIHPVIALNLYSKNLLVNNQLVPSFLNGGMHNIHCVFYIFCAFYIFINELNHLIDISDIANKNKKIETNNIIIKNYKNLTDRQQNILTNLEINYGRLSMILSPWFAYYELITKNPIIYSLDSVLLIGILILTTIISIFRY